MKGIKQTKSQGGPSSGAGLMRFFDVSGGGPQVSPLVVIAAAIGIIILEILLAVLV